MSISGFMAQKILMVFAHADDETLLAGALIAKLVADGHEVSVLCLAPGDDDRTDRLRNACDDLGVVRCGPTMQKAALNSKPAFDSIPHCH
jgi:LmbE family N-acetylglucosaminyl deacetylase